MQYKFLRLNEIIRDGDEVEVGQDVFMPLIEIQGDAIAAGCFTRRDLPKRHVEKMTITPRVRRIRAIYLTPNISI